MTARRNLSGAGPLRRPHRSRQRKKRFLVCCEGIVTEPRYLRAVRLALRNPLVEVVIGEDPGDPKQLVEQAIRERESARRDARLQHDENLLYDEVWCMFDVDEHKRLADARQLAEAHSIELAVSNPCIELWFLLHFEDQRGHLERDKVRAKLQAIIPSYDKEIDFSRLAGNCATAVGRARQLDTQAARNGDPSGNPTTRVWQLVANLCEQASVPVDML